jgi:hypothetical protein
MRQESQLTPQPRTLQPKREPHKKRGGKPLFLSFSGVVLPIVWECDPLFVAERRRSGGAIRYPDFVGEKRSSEARRRPPAAPQKPNIGGNNGTLAECREDAS